MRIENRVRIASLCEPEERRMPREESIMNAWLKYVGMGCIALTALACGAKGNDDENDGDDTGGKSGSGGGGGTGGSSTGGTGGGGPLPVMTTRSFDVASDVCPIPTMENMAGCWRLVDTNADPNTSTPVPAADITFRHTTDDGDPEAGAFEATIPYDQPSQWVSFGINFDQVDLSNRIISAKIKIASGPGTPEELMTAPVGTKVYAKSGTAYCYANGAYFNQGDTGHTVGEWQTIQFNLLRRPDYVATGCTFDAADIREIGVQFDTNSMLMNATEAVVLIDTVTY